MKPLDAQLSVQQALVGEVYDGVGLTAAMVTLAEIAYARPWDRKTKALNVHPNRFAINTTKPEARWLGIWIFIQQLLSFLHIFREDEIKTRLSIDPAVVNSNKIAEVGARKRYAPSRVNQ